MLATAVRVWQLLTRPRTQVHKAVFALWICLAVLFVNSSQAQSSSGSVAGARTTPEKSIAESYKSAMDAQRWPDAHALSVKLTDSAPGDALAWYRRARAAKFDAQWEDARSSLDKAIALDPKMTFSQAPERVKALDGDITNGLSARAAPTVASPVAPTSTASEITIVGAVVPAAVEVVTATSSIALRGGDTSSVASIGPTKQEHVIHVPVGTQLLGVLLLVAIIAGTWVVWRRGEIATRNFTDFLSRLDQTALEEKKIYHLADIFEGMTRVQREMHALKERLSEQGLTDTAIGELIDTVLPELERNIGLAPLQELYMRGMDAGNTTQEEVTRRLLHMNRTGRYTVSVAGRT